MPLADSVSVDAGRASALTVAANDDVAIHVVQSRAALSAWRDEWHRLWEQRSSGTVFQHFAWADAWIESFGERGEMCVAVATDSTRPARALAILPMWAGEHGELFLIGDPSSDYQDLVCARDGDEIDAALHAMLQSLAGARRGWKRMVFDNLREDSILLPALRRLAAAGRLPFAASDQLSSRCPVVGIRDRPAVLDEILKKKSLRRHYNAMAKLPGFRYRRVDSADEAALLLDALFDQHVARWAINGGRSLFAEQRNRDFYRRLVASPGFFRFIHFVAVEVEGRPIATHLGFLRGDTFIWYKPAFDPNFERKSPGEVMMRCLFDEFQAAGLGEFDFTRGEESFKSRFATQVRQSHRITLFASSVDKAVYSTREKLRYGEQEQGLFRLAAIAVKPAIRALRRVVTALQSDGASGIAAGLQRALGFGDRNAIVFRAEKQQALPPLPGGFDVSFGEADLLVLGRLSLQQPQYLSAARLAQAVTRKSRGDRVLTITNADGAPVHFSWLQSGKDGIAIDEIDDRLPLDGDDSAPIIYDAWTAPQAERAGLSTWALGYVANRVTEGGAKAWYYCMSRDRNWRRNAEAAGFAVHRRVSGK